MKLQAVLGPVQLVFYGVGVIVGAGVYSIIGAAAGLAGDSLWLSFVLAAIVAALTAVSYAEMATTFPAAGAEYVYMRQALPERPSLAFGVAVVVLAGGAASATTVAMAFGGYLSLYLAVSPVTAAVLLLAASTALSIWGLREASGINALFTTIEVAGLLLVIAAALTHEGFAAPLAAPPQSGVLAGAAIVFFVYLGFEELANLAEEAHAPARDIPRAIFISLAVTTILYVLVALAVVVLATPQELAASRAPLVTALERSWPSATGLLGAMALFATANTVLAVMIATSRLALAMAREGELPRMFAALTPYRRTPLAATLLCLALSLALTPIGSLQILAELSSFSALLAFLAVNAALIILRYRQPDHPRPFRAPLTIGRLPLLPTAAIATIVVLLFQFDKLIYLGGGVALALCLTALVAKRIWSALRESMRRKQRGRLAQGAERIEHDRNVDDLLQNGPFDR